MKLFDSRANAALTSPDSPASSPRRDRRNLVVGAGVAGVAAVAAQAVYRNGAVAPAQVVASSATVGSGDGYQVTPHVLRYYETAKI